MSYPNNKQELFEAYIKAKISVICEYSGNISEDVKELKDWHTKFAIENGLNLREDWSDYIYEED